MFCCEVRFSLISWRTSQPVKLVARKNMDEKQQLTQMFILSFNLHFFVSSIYLCFLINDIVTIKEACSATGVLTTAMRSTLARLAEKIRRNQTC